MKLNWNQTNIIKLIYIIKKLNKKEWDNFHFLLFKIFYFPKLSMIKKLQSTSKNVKNITCTFLFI